MKRAVFVDRDGTLNRDPGYLHRRRDLRLLPGAASAIRLLNRAGLQVVLVTNQSGIGRGYFPARDVEAVHAELRRRLGLRQARLDAIYYCPHRPEARCACRKPRPGLLRRAAKDLGLDLEGCFVIGDKASDVEAGRRARCRTVLVLTGEGRRFRSDPREGRPDRVARDLLEAARWVVRRARR